MRNIMLSLVLVFSLQITMGQQKLTGSIICDGTNLAIENADKAFDNNIDSYFESSNKERAWIGYDLGNPHVITKVRWCPRVGSFERAISTFTRKGYSYALNQTYRYETTDYGYFTQVSIFQGANKPDFSDAITLYVIPDQGIGGQYEEAEVNVTRAFRYVRFVASAGSNGYISEIEFHGIQSNGSDDQFYQATNLPLISINVKDSKEIVSQLNQDTLRAYITIVSENGKSILEDSCTIRGRGNDSFRYPKKPYRIKFYQKKHLLDSPAKAKKWTLINSYGDKSLMRNYLSFDFYQRIGAEYVPYCRLVDVIINGDYKGTYQLCDQLEVNKNRVNIDEMNENDIEGENLSGGYFFEYDVNLNLGYNSLHDIDQGFYTTGTYAPTALTDVSTVDGGYNSPICIKSPDNIADTQFEYLRDFISNVENEVKNGNLNHLDTESFLKYFLTGEYTGNTDEFHEVYLYKKRNDDKLYYGPIWDGDLGYNNDFKSVEYEEDSVTIENGWLYEAKGRSTVLEDVNCGDKAKHGGIRHLVTRVLENEGSAQRLKELWAYLRGGGLVSKEVIRNMIDSVETELATSARLNYRRWPILEEVAHNEAIARGTYEAEVDAVRTYSNRRINWIDKKLDYASVPFDIEVSSAGWATLYVPFAFQVPESMKIYSINKIKSDGITLNLKEVSSTEPNKPYIVKALPGHYNVEGAIVPSVDKNSLGLLTGTNHDMVAPEGSYVLQNHNGRVCFYRVYPDTNIHVGPTHAFLMLPHTAEKEPLRAYYFDEQAEGFDEIIDSTDSYALIYNITGHYLGCISNSSWSKEDISRLFGAGLYIVKQGSWKRKICVM